MSHWFQKIWYQIWPINPIEALLTIFALFAWSRAILKFRSKIINQKELIFWSFLWLTAIIIVFIPGKTTFLAHLLGMGRGFDAMVFLAIIALFYAVYRLYIKSNEVDQDITQIVRQMALRGGIKKSQGRKVRKIKKK